jgi:hypothetical protein
MHQQNVMRSGSHTQTSPTLWEPSPVLLRTSTCSQPPLELCKMLSDCARAFSSSPESTCSNGGAFRMLQDLTIRIVKFWSYGDLCAGLRETWCCNQWFLGFDNRKAIHRSYWSFFQSQDLLHHNMACIISVAIYIHSKNQE